MGQKLSVFDVQEVVSDCDIGNAILTEIKPSEIDDEELSSMWRDARALLKKIEAYLEDNSIEPDEDDEDDLPFDDD